MGQHEFKNDAPEMRVDVTLLREGLNVVKGLCNQLLGNEEASLEDYQTIMMQIVELCDKTLWKEGEAVDAGFAPPPGGWMPLGDNREVEIVQE